MGYYFYHIIYIATMETDWLLDFNDGHYSEWKEIWLHRKTFFLSDRWVMIKKQFFSDFVFLAVIVCIRFGKIESIHRFTLNLRGVYYIKMVMIRKLPRKQSEMYSVRFLVHCMYYRKPNLIIFSQHAKFQVLQKCIKNNYHTFLSGAK